MTSNPTGESTARKPLRVWPGVAIVALQWLLWSVVTRVFPEGGLIGIFGAIGCTLMVLAWWLFFSRAPWVDRLGAIVFMVLAIAATRFIVHPSIAGGMMGNMLYVYSIPPLCLALVAGAVLGRDASNGWRRVTIAASILVACGGFAMIRTDGVFGAGSQLAWRWSKTAEERLLAQVHDDPSPAEAAKEQPAAPAAAPAVTPAAAVTPAPSPEPAAETVKKLAPVPPPPVPTKEAEWPGFRGRARDAVIHGVQVQTDWSQAPPVEMWRRPVGPGWSSFAVAGDLFYTQEQRGAEEIVACYRVSTGKPVWRHRDAVRFWESNGGPGPRGTPTISNGRVYSFGATGLLNVLDARSGAVLWSRNVATDAEKKVPMWGFTSSPLVLDDVVVVAASGKLVGYELVTGTPRWFGPARPGSYSSPHLMTIDGVPQIVLLTAAGVISVAPADGKLLWENAWEGGATIVQPGMTADGDVLVNTIVSTGGVGTRRLAVKHEQKGWSVEERWTSTGLKPYFNDFVIHKGHAYGFDGAILSCIDLADGRRVWKGGRYGNGQLMLLPDQDLMLVLSEEGDLALVQATPDQFTEVAKFKAIEGKTWNHPALVGDVLLVRNGEEMAAFKLSLLNH